MLPDHSVDSHSHQGAATPWKPKNPSDFPPAAAFKMFRIMRPEILKKRLLSPMLAATKNPRHLNCRLLNG